MAQPQPPELTFAHKAWALAAALLFLIAIALLGFALNTGVLRSFAIGWVVLQIVGFVGALKLGKGDVTHPLFKAQVMLHMMALFLLGSVIAKAYS